MEKECQKILEEHLRLYRKYKAEVNTTLQRVAVWEEMLKKGELWAFEYSVSKLAGMPGGGVSSSPVETEVRDREVTAEMVREWIEDDRSRVYYKKVEVEQIEEALKALTREQRTVIEAKYFDGMTWRNIETLFNEKYSVGRVCIQVDGIRKINRESLEILWEILGPLFQRYLYFKRLL